MVNSKRFLKAVTAGFVVLLLCGVLFGASSFKRSSKRLLRIVPAKSLFCVCINNLENTIEEVNEFLKDIAPPSVNARTMVLAKLDKLLGDENLSGVNTKGHFAMFGVEIQGTQPGRHPMANMFIGALIPIRNFDRFISGNPNCSEPDDEGISTITVDGQPRAIATNFRRFVIFCSPNAREKLIQVKEMMGQRRNSLFRALDTGEKEMAATSPVWFYANAKQGSKLVQPILFAGLEKMKAQLQKAKEKGEDMPMDPAAIVGFYSGILKMLLGGTEHITVGISPTSEICNVNVSVKPVPCSEFEKIIGKPVNGSFENLLGYLDNGAWMNIASKIDRKSMNALYMELFDLMGEMTKESISEKQLNKLKKQTTKMINAMGDSLAMSFGLAEESSLFEFKYVIEVRNRKAFEKVINKQLRMMEKGTFNELYKGFGIEMNFEVERNCETYKDIQIDAAKLSFKMGDEDSPQNQMFQRIWGGGFNYRWAFVDNYCIYSIGGNADKKIREMIDQVKSGHPKKIGSEMKAALDMIPQSKHAEAVGTFNYVRLLDLMPKMMPVTDREDLSKLKVPSESNIAFACGFDNGNATMQIAVPKKHLLEIKTAFKTLIPQIKKQEELQRQRQREKSNLFNGKDLSGWHVDVPKMDNDPDVKSPFIVRNGMLVSLGTPNGHLITDAVHQNYRLEVQYRFPAKPGNCGVLVHASTPRALYQMFPKSIEVQMFHENAGDFWCIVEDISVPNMEQRRGPKEEWGITEGKKRRILNLTDGSENPTGQWNTMVIECLNDSIMVWVNGDLVNHGYDCTANKGQIALQAEGSEVEFRKILLTPINKLSSDK